MTTYLLQAVCQPLSKNPPQKPLCENRRLRYPNMGLIEVVKIMRHANWNVLLQRQSWLGESGMFCCSFRELNTLP